MNSKRSMNSLKLYVKVCLCVFACACACACVCFPGQGVQLSVDSQMCLLFSPKEHQKEADIFAQKLLRWLNPEKRCQEKSFSSTQRGIQPTEAPWVFSCPLQAQTPSTAFP